MREQDLRTARESFFVVVFVVDLLLFLSFVALCFFLLCSAVSFLMFCCLIRGQPIHAALLYVFFSFSCNLYTFVPNRIHTYDLWLVFFPVYVLRCGLSSLFVHFFAFFTHEQYLFTRCVLRSGLSWLFIRFLAFFSVIFFSFVLPLLLLLSSLLLFLFFLFAVVFVFVAVVVVVVVFVFVCCCCYCCCCCC